MSYLITLTYLSICSPFVEFITLVLQMEQENVIDDNGTLDLSVERKVYGNIDMDAIGNVQADRTVLVSPNSRKSSTGLSTSTDIKIEPFTSPTREEIIAASLRQVELAGGKTISSAEMAGFAIPRITKRNKECRS